MWRHSIHQKGVMFTDRSTFAHAYRFYPICLSGLHMMRFPCIMESVPCVRACVQRPEVRWGGGGIQQSSLVSHGAVRLSRRLPVEARLPRSGPKSNSPQDSGGRNAQRLNYSMFCSFFLQVSPSDAWDHIQMAGTVQLNVFCRLHWPHLVEKCVDANKEEEHSVWCPASANINYTAPTAAF